MAKVLILFAHPALENSRIQQRLIGRCTGVKGVTFRDLYQLYPDFDIDIAGEQKLLLDHDVIIWQHPFYWYSAPAIIKQWLDLVLEHGWAYGKAGTALKGKMALNAISCGGRKEVYNSNGRNRHRIGEFLLPFDQTSRLCNMSYLPPFVVDGTHRLSEADMDFFSLQYEQLLLALVNERISFSEWQSVDFLNDLCPVPTPFQS